jgi:tRNA (guanine26-N2/guanine27-N2)-dimethyltransferase
MEKLAGWPGELHREGRTLFRISDGVSQKGVGPATKDSTAVFYNPAMAGSRTRSVILMQTVIESGYLGEKEIYAIDGLSASGLRARRWLNELPEKIAARLDVTICDMDEKSLNWAMATHEEFPPNKFGILRKRVGDLRTAVLDHGRHWVDIDPFGSPMPFLDTAIQSLARRAVIEVSATDSAALTGSSKSALLRRYGARVLTDGLCHDSGMRVMLANIARIAASHDRFIEPILSVWDSHHLRVSVKVTKSIEGANRFEENIGWRIAKPVESEVMISIKNNLHPKSDLDILPMHCFVPLSHPVDSGDKRFSGPMWIGPTGVREVMEKITEQATFSQSSPIFQKDDPLGWSEKEIEIEQRKISRNVRYISSEATAIHCPHFILTDDLASWLKIGSPPSPNIMAELLEERGHCAARAHYAKPAFRTDAPWHIIVEVANSIQSEN